MFRFLPWRREGLSALLRLILVVGLLEGVRSGYFAGLLPFYAPEHLGLGPAAFTLAFTLHQLAENLSKAAGGLLAERLGYGLTVTLAAATGLLALLLRRGGGRGVLEGLDLEGLREALEAAVALSALACTVRGAGLPEEGLAAWRARWLAG